MAELLRALAYLGGMGVIAILAEMYFAERKAKKYTKVLQVHTDGSNDTTYIPKQGGKVEITVKVNNEEITRTWPINELATIDQQYPDFGLLPAFLTRTIKTVILQDGDWEPMLNRSPHRTMVASPDVLNQLIAIGKIEGLPKDVKSIIDELTDNVSTGPSRELIGTPDWIGSLRKSTILKALAQVSDDLLVKLEVIGRQLSRISNFNPTIVYIGLALSIILNCVVVYLLYNLSQTGGADAATIQALNRIQDALGIAR